MNCAAPARIRGRARVIPRTFEIRRTQRVRHRATVTGANRQLSMLNVRKTADHRPEVESRRSGTEYQRRRSALRRVQTDAVDGPEKPGGESMKAGNTAVDGPARQPPSCTGSSCHSPPPNAPHRALPTYPPPVTHRRTHPGRPAEKDQGHDHIHHANPGIRAAITGDHRSARAHHAHLASWPSR